MPVQSKGPGWGLHISILLVATYWLLLIGITLWSSPPEPVEDLIQPVLVLVGGPLSVLAAMKLRLTVHNQLSLLAYQDDLTGLENRRAFVERASDLLPSPVMGSVGLILFDIDSLKLVNDSCGHQAGDEMILATAEMLRQAAGEGKSVYRIGGDEFAVLLDRTKGESLAPVIEHAAPFSKDFAFCGHQHLIQVSFGFASSNASEAFESLFARADQRLYDSKQRLYQSGQTGRRRAVGEARGERIAEIIVPAEAMPDNIAYLQDRRPV